MQLSIATANLYTQPFQQALAIIAEAGFRNIELDLFWERKNWAMAQHLQGLQAKEVVRWIEQSGLKVTSIHDGGGVVESGTTITGYINPTLDEFLDQLGYAPDGLVFHVPHIEGEYSDDWWTMISGQIVSALDHYKQYCSYVTLENEPPFSGYYVSLVTPQALNAFATQYDIGVTLDTNHYAYMGVDIVTAARVLRDNIRTIHLSDYLENQANVFIGEGELDFVSFFATLDLEHIHAVTAECSLMSPFQPNLEMDHDKMITRMIELRETCEQLIHRVTAA